MSRRGVITQNAKSTPFSSGDFASKNVQAAIEEAKAAGINFTIYIVDTLVVIINLQQMNVFQELTLEEDGDLQIDGEVVVFS
jgi:uncharacterized protein GlcG (DUF336 family)